MRKYLPFILLGLGILVLVGAYFFLFKKSKTEAPEDGEALIEVPLSDRPVTSLTPDATGHWLKLVIEKIEVGAESLDYELLYELPDGRTQGVPGSIKLSGEAKIERDLLLGSESSGKFRYDEGVKQGTLTLRFRNDKGKLIAKFSTKFHLQSDEKELTSPDGKFTYSLTKVPNDFFVTMETFGVPKDPSGEVSAGPFGVFSSSEASVPGTVKLEGGTLFRASSSGWDKVEDGKASDIGIFVTTSQ